MKQDNSGAKPASVAPRICAIPLNRFARDRAGFRLSTGDNAQTDRSMPAELGRYSGQGELHEIWQLASVPRILEKSGPAAPMERNGPKTQ